MLPIILFALRIFNKRFRNPSNNIKANAVGPQIPMATTIVWAGKSRCVKWSEMGNTH